MSEIVVAPIILKSDELISSAGEDLGVHSLLGPFTSGHRSHFQVTM